MREEQLSNHHGAVCLDLIQVQIQHLKIRALLQRFSQVLRALRLNVVALEVEAEETGRLGDEVGKGLRAVIGDFIIAEVNVRNINGVLLERLAQHNERLVVDSVCEVVFVVTEDGQVN